MCRLTAWVGPARPLDVLVYGGDHPLLEQAWAPRELLQGSVNADGWGVAWYDPGGGPARLARARPVWHEPDLEGLLGDLRASVAVAALRNTTPGLPVDEAGTPPLVHDRWSFVLNGFIPDFRARHMRALRSALSDEAYGALTGVSDTETLFLLAVDALRAGAPRGDALAAAVDRVLARVGDAPCHLTALLADARGASVIRTSTVDAVNSLYVLRDGALGPGGVLLASERLDGDPAWAPVTPRRVVDVDLDLDGGGPDTGSG